MDPKVDSAEVSLCGGSAPLAGCVVAQCPGGSGEGGSVRLVSRM